MAVCAEDDCVPELWQQALPEGERPPARMHRQQRNRPSGERLPVIAWKWYWLIAACITCYVLGLLHGKDKAKWKSVLVSAVAGALWPLTLIAGWWIDKIERDGSA